MLFEVYTENEWIQNIFELKRKDTILRLRQKVQVGFQTPFLAAVHK
jgi:hypothetical protein